MAAACFVMLVTLGLAVSSAGASTKPYFWSEQKCASHVRSHGFRVGNATVLTDSVKCIGDAEFCRMRNGKREFAIFLMMAWRPVNRAWAAYLVPTGSSTNQLIRMTIGRFSRTAWLDATKQHALREGRRSCRFAT
jgi:hypothetical protein